MAGKTSRAGLVLSEAELGTLKEKSRSRVLSVREVQRAKILLMYSEGKDLNAIANAVNASRSLVYRCIDKALGMGIDAGLKDLPERGKEAIIGDDAKMWVMNIACIKPKDLGYAAEVWSRQSLAQHVRKCCKEAGHPILAKAGKSTIQRILNQGTLRPDKIRYYLERRDPAFEVKMREVLLVYKEVFTAEKEVKNGGKIITVSVDEKPGVQAIANTAVDLPPVPRKYATIARDHEYERLGTASIIAALDLHDGHVTVRVELRHRSREFILLLQDLDTYYPKDAIIRVILDNHSSHTSKETRAFLATRPNRFVYVHTPTHGSWLNLAENLFGKMARTFLKHIRVASWEKLKERIIKGVAEMNDQPVVFRWTKFQELLDKK